MLPSNTAVFDAVASTYDASFTHTLIGRAQRAAVREQLQVFLKNKPPLKILEINCGTGEDALWLASQGHSVIATDVAAGMINEAKQKTESAGIDHKTSFIQSGFEQLYATFQEEQFDLIFSNFSGLNCLPAEALITLSHDLSALLRSGGCMAVVIFGKYTIWETLYYGCRLNFRQAFQRWQHKTVNVPLKEDVAQPVYYYSIRRFKSLMHGFRLLQQRPVGLFIPPSYLDGSMKKRMYLYNKLVKLDKAFSQWAAFSAFADHTFLLFEKKML
jgi:SAM-dependent methyltransferase